MKTEMKSETWLIVEFAGAIMALAILSFFFNPAYEKGVWFGIGVFALALQTVIGYKFGKNMPQQAGDAREGMSSVSEIKTESKTISPAAEPESTTVPIVVK
jgi:hypothetical protein